MGLKIFLLYCAFSPMIALSMCIQFGHWFSSEHYMALALPCCLICLPLTCVLVLTMAFYRARSEKVAAITTTLATYAHFAFYGHLAVISADYDSKYFWITAFSCLLFSGIALLLTWDNLLKPEVKIVS